MSSQYPGNIDLNRGRRTMRKLAGILLALGVVGSPSLAMAADVVTEVCTVNVPKQLLTFIEASSGVILPLSCKGASANCTQCDADLLSQGFRFSKAVQVNTNSPYFVFTRGMETEAESARERGEKERGQ
jgi:hypothetical protein